MKVVSASETLVRLNGVITQEVTLSDFYLVDDINVAVQIAM
jgi:hypothetical protein